MNRKKAIKKYEKIIKMIGKIVTPLESLGNSSDELANIALELKSEKLAKISINIKKSFLKLLLDTNDLFDSFERFGDNLFRYPYFF